MDVKIKTEQVACPRAQSSLPAIPHPKEAASGTSAVRWDGSGLELGLGRALVLSVVVTPGMSSEV